MDLIGALFAGSGAVGGTGIVVLPAEGYDGLAGAAILRDASVDFEHVPLRRSSSNDGA
jgi:hypothetical protein